MSQSPTSRRSDLARLREEGYNIAIESGRLVVRDIPYVTANKKVERGIVVSDLELAGDAVNPVNDHVVRFAGDMPCDKDGNPLTRLVNGPINEQMTPELGVNFLFSHKPLNGVLYTDYYEKLTTYINLLAGPAAALDPTATPRTYAPVKAEEDSVFMYEDTASSRAGITLATEHLKIARVAIVGLGGTGSYILDLLAKCPIGEIHLFDGDTFHQHTAFRAPGAPSFEGLGAAGTKVAYLAGIYSNMHRFVIPHEYRIDEETVEELRGFDFVFLAIDSGASRALIAERLEAFDVPFIDTGLGVYLVDDADALAGTVRVTTSTREQRDHLHAKVSMVDSDDDIYARNIQVADLNMLNAALAVGRWKRQVGFYNDLEREHHSLYDIDGNHMLNEQQAP